MEGRHRQAARFRAFEQRADALFHLARGLVGKGHGDDMAGLDAAVLYQVGNLAGDHAGLAGACAGEHQKWAADIVHGFLLPGVQSGHGVNRQAEWARILTGLALSAVTIWKCVAVHIMANRQAWLIFLIQYSGATFGSCLAAGHAPLTQGCA